MTSENKAPKSEWNDFWVGLVVLAVLIAGIVVLPLALIGAGVIVLIKNILFH